MFKLNMTVEDMDNIISKQAPFIIEEVVKKLSTQDLKVYLDTFRNERNVKEADFADMTVVGSNAFYIASEYQQRLNDQMFKDFKVY